MTSTKIISQKQNRHLAFPILFQDRKNKNKLTIYYRDANRHMFDPYSKIIKMFSLNCGKTWNNPEIVYQDKGYDCRNYAGGVTSDNEYILFFSKWDGGYAGNNFEIFSIKNENIMEVPFLDGTVSPYGKLVETGQMRMQGYYTGGPNLPENKIGIIYKYDDFLKSNTIFTGLDYVTFTETDFEYIGNGKIIGVSRNEKSNAVGFFKSNDYGETWKLELIPIKGDIVPWITYLPDRNEVAILTGREYDKTIGLRIMDAEKLFKNPVKSFADTPPVFPIKYPSDYTDYSYPSAAYIEDKDKLCIVHHGGKGRNTSILFSSIDIEKS